MKKLTGMILGICYTLISFSQQTIIDRGHLAIVNENGFVRIASEMAQGAYLEKINDRLGEIKINLGAVVLSEELVYRSLKQVNDAFRDGKGVVQVSLLAAQVSEQSAALLKDAASSPHLLLFCELTCRQLKDRGIRLLGEVSEVVIKEQSGLLLNHEKRDALLQKITLELKVIRALIFSIKKCMYWAKVNGVLKSVNPFSGFINTDRQLAGQILSNYKSLKK